MVSVPYGVMSRSAPAASSASHSASPSQPLTLTSKASSPEKLIRQTRARSPATAPSRQVMNGNASLSTASSGATRASTSRERGPTRATVAHCSVTDVQSHRQVRPLGLQPLLHPVQDRRGVAGRRGEQEPVLGQAHHRAVVDRHPVDPAHDAVADRADLEGADEVGVDEVEQPARVRALHLDLAEGGGVHHRHRLPGGPALPQHGGLLVLARAREEPRTLPLPDVLEPGAGADVPLVQRRDPLGVVQVPAVTPGQRRERHRRVRRPERRRAQVGDAHAEGVGDDAGGDDPRRLALVVGGPDGRVALDVLHRPQARPRSRAGCR